MVTPLRVLILEDRPADAELMVHELRRGGIDPEWQCVDNREDFLAALDPPPDVILSDYSLPQWDAPRALLTLKELGLDIPTIVLSGTVGEETAIHCIKQGADDYLLKDRMARLGSAVIRALEDRRLRAERRQAEIALVESEERYRSLFNHSSLGIGYYTLQGHVIAFNRTAAAYMGGEPEDYAGSTLSVLYGEAAGAVYLERIKRAAERPNNEEYEDLVQLPTGNLWFRSTYSRIIDASGQVIGIQIVSNDVTERKLAESAVRASEARYRRLFEAAKDGILILNADTGEVEDANPFLLNLLGYSLEELLGKSLWEIGVFHDIAASQTAFQELQQKEYIRYENLPLETHDGRHIEVEFVSNVYLVNGEKVIQCNIRDITERRRIEQALAETYKKLDILFDILPVGVSVLDRSRNIILQNPALGKILDLAPEGLAQGTYKQRTYLQADGTPMPLEGFASTRVLNGEAAVHDVVTGVKMEDGSLTWTSVSAVACPLEDWNAVIVTTDITERRRLEEAERKQRTLAEALRDTAAALIRAVDFDAVLNTLLKNVARVVENDAANIMLVEGENARVVAWEGYPPEISPLLQGFQLPLSQAPHLRHMLDTRLSYLISYTDESPDWIQHAHTKWVKSYVAVPVLSHGNVIGILNVDSATPGFYTETHARHLQAFADQASLAIERAQLYEEISRHAAELERRVHERTAQLNHAKERIEAILNSSNDVVILVHEDGTIDQVNPAFNEVFGYVNEEIFNKPLANLVIPEHVALLEDLFRASVQAHQAKRLEVIAKPAAGPPFAADFVLSPVVAQDQTLHGVVCSLRDITEIKQIESHLRQMLTREMELNELKSRYVSMAAHDLRNPLAVIQTSIGLVQKYSDRMTESKREEKYQHIQNSINVMVNMLDDILTLGKVESGKLRFTPAPVNATDLCKNLVAEMKQGSETARRVVLLAVGEAGISAMDSSLLRHIVNNLLSNALKYSADDSPVTLTVRTESEQIVFIVQDHGIGIPAADQERLFETFHRASNAKQIPGTGLGLAIVKESVDQHGGTVTVESQEGVGTVVTVVLPRQ